MQVLQILSIISGILSAIIGAINLMTQTPADIARKNLLSWFPDWLLLHSGQLFWILLFLTIGLSAWRSYRAYEFSFVNLSSGKQPAQQLPAALPVGPKRDTWFQHAAFYVAFGVWPDVLKPIFLFGEGNQVPEGEHVKLIEALQKLRQAAFDGELTVWGKFPVTPYGPRQHSVFDTIPVAHWRDHAVDYMDLIRFNEPSHVRTTRNHEHSPDAWCALQVSKLQAEALWPPKIGNGIPLKILVGSGAPFDEYRLDEYGRHHTVNALLYNGGSSKIDGVRLFRTYVPEGASGIQRALLCGPISLAAKQRQPISIAGYNESEKILEINRMIVLAAPSAGFNASTMLAPGRYSLILEADSIDGFAFKANCRLWVDFGNVLRLENLENIAPGNA